MSILIYFVIVVLAMCLAAILQVVGMNKRHKAAEKEPDALKRTRIFLTKNKVEKSGYWIQFSAIALLLFVAINGFCVKKTSILGEGISLITQETNNGVIGQYFNGINGKRKNISDITNGILIHPEQYIVNVVEWEKGTPLVNFGSVVENRIFKHFNDFGEDKFSDGHGKK